MKTNPPFYISEEAEHDMNKWAAEMAERRNAIFFLGLPKPLTPEQELRNHIKYAHVIEDGRQYIGLAHNETLEVYAINEPYPELKEPLEILPNAKFVKWVESLMEL